MAVESKRVLRKILRKRRHRRGIPDDLFQDSEEPTVEPRQNDEPSDVMKLQKMVGNQGIQRLFNGDKKSDAKDDNKKADIAKIIETFKASRHYEMLEDTYSNTIVDDALFKLADDTRQIMKMYEYKQASFPLLARAVRMQIEGDVDMKTLAASEEQKQVEHEEQLNTFPWMGSVRKSTSKVSIPDPPPAPPDPPAPEEKGEATEDLKAKPGEKQDPREQKQIEEFFSREIIDRTAETKLAVEALLMGSYKEIPQEILEEFTKMSDHFQVSRAKLSNLTRTTAKDAAVILKKLSEEAGATAKKTAADPMKAMGGVQEGIKDSTLKLALDARKALTDLLMNKPKEADKSTKDKAAEQDKKIKDEAEAAPAALPDVGGIKAMGFIMKYDSFRDTYRTSSKGMRSSDPKSGVFAEERVVQDLKSAPMNSTVIILSAHEPISSRKQAIRNFAVARPDLSVFSCWVQGDLGKTGNLFVNATKGSWKLMGYFK